MTLQCAVGAGWIPPLPIDIFRIELEPPEGNPSSSWYTPGDDIKGKLIISNFDSFNCNGIRVALEGSAIVSYQYGKAMRNKMDNLLPFEWATLYFTGGPSEIQENVNSSSVPKGIHEYAFSIPIRKLNPFPGTFKGPSGEIVYRVTGYIDTISVSSSTAVQKSIKIKSYLNLRSIPDILKPGILNGQQSKGFFSMSRGRLKFCFWLPSTGFLAGEKIPFKVTFINREECERDVSSVTVSLLRKLAFKSDVSSRVHRSVLESCESGDLNHLKVENVEGEEPVLPEWAHFIQIPENTTYPTFAGLIIQCLYSVKMEINLEGEESPIVGEIPITIGTVREIQRGFTVEDGTAARALSMVSLASTTESVVSLPPPYSELSSRRSSISTLPPFYDDAIAVETNTLGWGDSPEST